MAVCMSQLRRSHQSVIFLTAAVTRLWQPGSKCCYSAHWRKWVSGFLQSSVTNEEISVENFSGEDEGAAEVEMWQEENVTRVLQLKI